MAYLRSVKLCYAVPSCNAEVLSFMPLRRGADKKNVSGGTRAVTQFGKGARLPECIASRAFIHPVIDILALTLAIRVRAEAITIGAPAHLFLGVRC